MYIFLYNIHPKSCKSLKSERLTWDHRRILEMAKNFFWHTAEGWNCEFFWCPRSAKHFTNDNHAKLIKNDISSAAWIPHCKFFHHAFIRPYRSTWVCRWWAIFGPPWDSWCLGDTFSLFCTSDQLRLPPFASKNMLGTEFYHSLPTQGSAFQDPTTHASNSEIWA